MFQYLPYLNAMGIDTHSRPLFGDKYLERKYNRQVTTALALTAYRRRLNHLKSSGRADVLWLEKEALPWVPWSVERQLIPSRVPVVSDYDDAIFHQYEMHEQRIVRSLLGRKIDGVMQASSLVMAGNAYLADRARSSGVNRVEVVPSVVDTDALKPSSGGKATAEPLIGWIGSPSTWAVYVVPILASILAAARLERAQLLAVGAGAGTSEHDEIVRHEPWSEATEATQITSMDIGIMPLVDSPWARGKCGFKLLQYMACGIPVVASPVGMNAEIVRHGENGLLASTEAEWRDAIGALLRDPHLRARLGAAGRQSVERSYSLKVWGPRVAALIGDVAEGSH